jgi:ribosomal protein L21E
MLSSTFHDKQLVSIAVADDTLTIEILTQDRRTKIRVVGLQKMRVTDFKEGNIINIVQAIHAQQSTESLSAVRSLLQYAYEISDDELQQDTKLSCSFDKKIEEYERGSLVILEIEPSYGAYLVAVGTDILEEEIHSPSQA